MNRHLLVSVVVLAAGLPLLAQPVVMSGRMVPDLLGTPIERLRVVNSDWQPVPFQVDEVVGDSEYACPSGPQPNDSLANGVLDSADEIVFLAEFASPAGAGAQVPPPADWPVGCRQASVSVRLPAGERHVRMVDNPSAPRPAYEGVRYDTARQTVSSQLYRATFGRDRFHFVSAGISVDNGKTYTDLTRELRIDIRMRFFWGLFGLHYTEENLVCTVKRYKVGPVRLIRCGDLHLKLGLGIKASRATVNQICYPSLVTVPVRVRLPVRFRSFFREAYIEMTPVLSSKAAGYNFAAPAGGLVYNCDTAGPRFDTLVAANPDHAFFSVDSCGGPYGCPGFGWLLETSIDQSLLRAGSGYVFAQPSPRGGMSHCGYRLGLQDLPKGHYLIANYVGFGPGFASFIQERCTGSVEGAGEFRSLLH